MTQTPQVQKSPFPAVIKSVQMSLLMAQTMALAQRGLVVPLVVPTTERLELKGFFVQAARTLEATHCLIENSDPDPYRLEIADDEALLLLEGERASPRTQTCIHRCLPNFRLVMVVAAEDLLASANSNGSPLRHGLREVCPARSLVWPGWKDRVADRQDILEGIRARLSMPGDRPVPEFSPLFVEMMCARDLGTLGIERAVKLALNDYIARGDTGPLQPRHAFTARDRRILCRKSLPPLSVIHGSPSEPVPA